VFACLVFACLVFACLAFAWPVPGSLRSFMSFRPFCVCHTLICVSYTQY
jgi:hypothetical protein